MIRALLLFGIVGFVGLALIFAEVRWFRRPTLTARLSPYTPGSPAVRPSLTRTAETIGEVIGPLTYNIGARVSGLFGIGERLETRLNRIHSPQSAQEFRLRQAAWVASGFVVGTMIAVATAAAPPIAILTSFGTPALAFLVIEQRLATASTKWQRQIAQELPVVTEQLGMLISAGWSLGSAINRIATRGTGACATDLAIVTKRIRHGLTDVEALQEWAERAEVEALSRLVSILALNRQTSDLGRLISHEGREIRRDAQRELIEIIERRQQQVWIPVTVAALIPGVLLMAVPFIDALRLFGS